MRVPTSTQTPAWLLDESSFVELMRQLREALGESHSGLTRFSSASLGHDTPRLEESVRLVANASKEEGSEVLASLAALSSHVHDPEFSKRFLPLVTELSTLWRVRATMAIEPRRARLLHQMLNEPEVDLLGVLRQEEYENSHSDVLRWLLDPREAPAVARVTLRALASRLPDRAVWCKALDEALATGALSVRREVVIGPDLLEEENRDRIDLVISWSGFVLGIENKVRAQEHEGQTPSYARWLRRLRRGGNHAAGIFLSPSGMPAASQDFVPMSYLELVRCLLEAPLHSELTRVERQVLGGYMRTLRRRILRPEFLAIAALEEAR